MKELDVSRRLAVELRLSPSCVILRAADASSWRGGGGGAVW